MNKRITGAPASARSLAPPVGSELGGAAQTGGSQSARGPARPARPAPPAPARGVLRLLRTLATLLVSSFLIFAALYQTG